VQTLEVFRLRSFDLVLIDGALAGLGALELIRRLRSPSAEEPDGGPRTDVPILILMEQDEGDERAALAAGADAILTPPLELEVLLTQLMQTVLDWRVGHPDRPWADQVAQVRSN
jgi:CheY-like chemotaxis protein